MAYTKYSLTPANNNAAPPDGAPEGMLPSAVNDTMRDMMAQIRDVGDGIRGGTYTMTAPVITGGSITGVALSGNTLTNPVITGGSINNTPIGASTANTGAFTTLSASSTATLNTLVSSGATLTGGSINGMAIGGSTAAAGNFTTLGATGVATFSAGTVSAPAITTTGDTNTGIFFPAADTIAFAEGGAESMRIDSSGNFLVGITSARSNAGDVQVSKGISFPATQSAQSDANTLDDYEEGTWTPTVQFGSGNTGMTVATSGTYTKIGRVVTVRCTLTFSAKGSSTGTFNITSLPFNVATGTNFSGTCGYNFAITTNGYTMFSFSAQGTNIVMYPLNYGDAANQTFFSNTTDIQNITITYFV